MLLVRRKVNLTPLEFLAPLPVESGEDGSVSPLPVVLSPVMKTPQAPRFVVKSAVLTTGNPKKLVEAWAEDAGDLLTRRGRNQLRVSSLPPAARVTAAEPKAPKKCRKPWRTAAPQGHRDVLEVLWPQGWAESSPNTGQGERGCPRVDQNASTAFPSESSSPFGFPQIK